MKKEVLLIILLIVALLAFLSFSRLFTGRSEEDARKFFAEDLAENYPTADAREIIDVSKIGEGPTSYYALKARVSYNLSTPCPSRTEVEYNYPVQNFIKRTDPLVYGCQVCINRPRCVLTYEEEAIIASHSYNGTEAVNNYLHQHPDAKPKATLLDSYADERNVWQVDWTANGAEGLRVYISQAQNQVIGTEIIAAPA